MKITFLAVMPSPYVQDLFATLAADPRVELTVWYLEQEAHDTYWGEQPMPEYARVLPGKWFWFLGARIHFNPSIRRELAASDADLFVIVGYVGATNQIAMRYLNRRGRRWVFWGEIPGLVSRSAIGRKLRQLAQRPLRECSGIAAVGSHAVAAYQRILTSLGKPKTPVVNLPYHCRLEDFQQAARLRQQADRVRFLYCGQLIQRKGVDLLCRAFANLIQNGNLASLTLVGEGPLREELKASLPEEVLSHVYFAGFQPVDQLPKWFAEADVFLLPSRHDGWGVVVNQAVASGMPIVASHAVGAANDLVVEGENGFRIEPGSTRAIETAMLEFTSMEKVESFGNRSRQISEQIQLHRAADDWHSFFEDALTEMAE